MKVEEVAKSILAPSITIIGLLLSASPVIGFFKITDLKRKQKEDKDANKKSLKEQIETWDFVESAEEDLKVLHQVSRLLNSSFENMISGVLKYLATFLAVAISALLMLLLLYIFLGSAQFILTNVLVLLTIITGVIPLIQIAMISFPIPESS